jgi:hypothetical protein
MAENSNTVVLDDGTTLQQQIGASNEEWIAIWSTLSHIILLRQEVSAAIEADGSNAIDPGSFGGRGGRGPGTQDSLEAPTGMGGRGGGRGGRGAGAGLNVPAGANPAPAAGTQGPVPVDGGGPPNGGPGMGGGRGPGRGGGPSTNGVLVLLSELKALMQDPGVPPDEIVEKLATVRATRKKARVDLSAAEKELMLLLTIRQQAILVSLGYLD